MKRGIYLVLVGAVVVSTVTATAGGAQVYPTSRYERPPEPIRGSRVSLGGQFFCNQGAPRDIGGFLRSPVCDLPGCQDCTGIPCPARLTTADWSLRLPGLTTGDRVDVGLVVIGREGAPLRTLRSHGTARAGNASGSFAFSKLEAPAGAAGVRFQAMLPERARQLRENECAMLSVEPRVGGGRAAAGGLRRPPVTEEDRSAHAKRTTRERQQKQERTGAGDDPCWACDPCVEDCGWWCVCADPPDYSTDTEVPRPDPCDPCDPARCPGGCGPTKPLGPHHAGEVETAEEIVVEGELERPKKEDCTRTCFSNEVGGWEPPESPSFGIWHTTSKGERLFGQRDGTVVVDRPTVTFLSLLGADRPQWEATGVGAEEGSACDNDANIYFAECNGKTYYRVCIPHPSGSTNWGYWTYPTRQPDPTKCTNCEPVFGDEPGPCR